MYTTYENIPTFGIFITYKTKLCRKRKDFAGIFCNCNYISKMLLGYTADKTLPNLYVNKKKLLY